MDIVIVLLHVLDPDAHEEWWATPIPALGGKTANEMWEEERYDELYEYVLTYLDPSFG